MHDAVSRAAAGIAARYRATDDPLLTAAERRLAAAARA
jgi:hypothetical protein